MRTISLDCVCHVMLFLSDQKIFLNCLLLNKAVYKHLNNNGCYCGKNIEFHFIRISDKIKKYVYWLYE
jgi:uncharacterized pyridoxamine 5'-phosphate oxidase family protein